MIDKRPALSIITVTLNNLEGLKATYESIKAQSRQDFEWIIIDGASCDGTQEWAVNTLCPDTQFISEADEGLYDAMNKGIAHASAPYLLFLNAGDRLAGGDVLRKIIDCAERDQPDFIYGDCFEKTRTGDLFYKKARPWQNYKSGMFASHQALIYRAEALNDFHYDTHYMIAADYDLTCRFLALPQKRISYLPFAVCVFESGGLSFEHARKGRMEEHRIRQTRGLVSAAENRYLSFKKFLAMALRRHAPALYGFLRYRGASF